MTIKVPTMSPIAPRDQKCNVSLRQNSSADTLDLTGNNQADFSAETLEPDGRDGKDSSAGDDGWAKNPFLFLTKSNTTLLS